MGGVPFASKTRIKHAQDKMAGNYNQFIKTPTKIKIANLELALFIDYLLTYFTNENCNIIGFSE